MTRRVAEGHAVRGLLLAILFGLLLGLCGEASGRVLTLTTTGATIVLEGNVARARNMAITNAKRQALAVAVMRMIPEGAMGENYDMLNESIYQQHERFIDTYRILSERTRDNIYEVTLESTVGVERLRRNLVTLGLIEEELAIERSSFRIKILGVSCSPCFRALKEYLKNEIEGVEDISIYAISPGRFTLDIVFRGDVEAFRYALLTKDFENFRLDPEQTDEEDLRFVMVLTRSEDG